MAITAYLLHEYDDVALDHLRARLDRGVQVVAAPNRPEPADYEILVAGRPKREYITASPTLKTLIIPWAGLPDETRELMLGFPQIAVHNLHHNAAPAAEMVVTLMLAAAKSTVPVDRAFRRHDWRPRYEPAPSLLMSGKTAMILGYGAIGQRVARTCQALGMDVIAVKRHIPDESEVEIQRPEALHTLLPRADALLICLPHTPQTDDLIGAEELALLPSNAVLVNVGRGAIVNQGALFNALREGTIHAAGLDVWYNYPADEPSRSCTPPGDYPFHELDNIVMSPHRGGTSDRRDFLRMECLAELLNAAARGEPMPNPVDVQAGY
jgi:phosphoglycerate dehydrogenase-like enzyme